MSTFEVCVIFASSILAVAYPILVEVISRLDEKYSSTVITDLFNAEKEKNFFTYSLYGSITFIAIYLLDSKPFYYFPQNVWILNNSALLLVSIFLSSTIISFFLLIDKIFKYYRQNELVKYLIAKHNALVISDENDLNNNHFIALSELLIYSIIKQNNKIAKHLSSFMYASFKKIREKNKSIEIQYPLTYYYVIEMCIEELALQKNGKVRFLETFTAGSIWLLGEFESNKLSALTYSWMWSNQKLSLKFDRDDFVVLHWQNAHQFYEYRLDFIQPIYSDNSTEPLNKIEIEKRSEERFEFYSFHCILASLLLYLKRIDALKKIFYYTQSIPPRYPLLPQKMDQIFYFLFKIENDRDKDFHFIESKYSFPGFDGMHADQNIREKIIDYLALLIIRQYSIVPYLTFQQPLELPALPDTQGEKKFWLEHLQNLKNSLDRIFKEKELLKILNFDFITEEYCLSHQKMMPLILVNELEKRLKEAITDSDITQEISKEKEEMYLNYTKETGTKAIETYKDLFTDRIKDSEYKSGYINGVAQIMEKNSFADSQGFTHFNFHSIVADEFSEKFQQAISEIFFFNKSEQYLLRDLDINKALQQLKIKDKKVTIVGFNYYHNLDGFQNCKLFYTTKLPLIGSCLFILEEKNLPFLKFRDTNDDWQEEYDLKKLNDNYYLYASVIDLNKKINLQDEIVNSGFNGDIRKQVLVDIYINAEMRWKKDIKCVALFIASPFKEAGIINSVSEIQSF